MIKPEIKFLIKFLISQFLIKKENTGIYLYDQK